MKHGYYPTDPLEAHRVDEILDAAGDVLGKAYTPHFAPEDQREAMYPDIFEKMLPNFLTKLDPYCAKGKFIAGGDDITIADFAVGGLYTNYLNNPSMSFAKDKWAAVLN